MSIADYSGMPLIKRPHKDLFISTNFTLLNDRFWDEYFTGKWEDTNKAWEKYVPPATGGVDMKKFFVQPININSKLQDLVEEIFKAFEIKSYDYRCSFFRVLPGGGLPTHIDQKSKCSFLIPVIENTGHLEVEDGTRLQYHSMVALNTLKPHSVGSPLRERIVFHLGVHDVLFSELSKV